MIFIIDWALDDSEIRKREKFAISKKKSAGGLLHDLEGKPDVRSLLRTTVLAVRITPLINIPKGFSSEMTLEVA